MKSGIPRGSFRCTSIVWLLSATALLAQTAPEATSRLAREKTNATWTVDGTLSTPRGEGAMHAEGEAWKTEDGREWQVNKTGTTASGADWSAATSGSATRTSDGATWQGTTTGSSESGREWTAVHSGTVTKNEDGTISIDSSTVKTLENGQTFTRSAETTVVKTEGGATWTTEASRTGPKGEGVMHAEGETKKTDAGREWSVNRAGTAAGGQTWQSTTAGTAEHSAEGVKWQSATEGQASGGATWKRSVEGKASWQDGAGIKKQGSVDAPEHGAKQPCKTPVLKKSVPAAAGEHNKNAVKKGGSGVAPHGVNKKARSSAPRCRPTK